MALDVVMAKAKAMDMDRHWVGAQVTMQLEGAQLHPQGIWPIPTSELGVCGGYRIGHDPQTGQRGKHSHAVERQVWQ
jgi:hypothetical protein